MSPVVARVNNLGVNIDSHLTFTHQVDQIVARAFSVLTRSTNIVSRDTASLTRAFK